MQKGFDTSINVNPITQDALSNVNVLVFVGPMTKFETQEINAIKKFVQNGGNLLVLAHISSPLNGLMQGSQKVSNRSQSLAVGHFNQKNQQ